MRCAVAAVVTLLALAPARAVADAGDLDRNYSRGGWATAFFPGWRLGTEIADLAVTPKGGAVVATSMIRQSGSYSSDPALAAFDANGRPDRSFSGDGRLTISTKGRDHEVDIAVQRDGKILVARDDASGFARVIRLRRSGKVDRSFGPNGEFIGGLRDLTELAVEPSGEILLAGSTPASPVGDVDFAVTRLLESGSVDHSFGGAGTGTATVDFHVAGESGPSVDVANSLATRPDGGVILCGRSRTTDGARDGVALAALSPDGALDPAFGDDGRVFADPDAGTGTPGRHGSGGGEDVAVGPRASVIFGGVADGDFTASSYTQFGRPDPLFADDGTAVVDATARDDADALAVARDGRVYLVGSVRGPGQRDYAVLRLTTGGVPDFSFGDGGLVALDYDGGWDDADGIDLRPNGKLLVSGTIGNDGLAIIRLHG